MMRLLDNLQYKAAINRHIHHDAYKVLAVLIPDSIAISYRSEQCNHCPAAVSGTNNSYAIYS